MESRESAWQQWVHLPQRLRLYNALFSIHYTVGAVLGMYVALMSSSGAIIVYRDELTLRRMVGEPPFESSGGIDRPLGQWHRSNVFDRVVPDGTFIWWRGIKNWRRGLTVGWRSNVSRISWDIHSALGFWFFAFLLVWAISGAYFAFPDFFNTVLPSRSPDSLNVIRNLRLRPK